MPGLFADDIDATSLWRRRQMPELEATASPTHRRTGATTPRRHSRGINFLRHTGAVIRDSTISKSETRLQCPTLVNQIQNPNANSWTPTVQYVEIFASVGSMSSAAEAHVGEIGVPTEKEPVARYNLRRRFPGAKIFHDIDGDSDWSNFEHKPGAALGLLAGSQCQPFAPTGKGEMEDGPRARFLIEGAGNAVNKLRPETADIETVCNAAGAKDGAILEQLDDSIIQHGYSRIVSDGGASPERASTSHLGSAVDLTRLAVHYERDDMKGGPLPKLLT